MPPFELAEPSTIEQTYLNALATKRQDIDRIAHNSEPPTFANTIESLEDTGRALRRAQALFVVYTRTMGSDAMSAVESRIAPLLPQLEDEIAHSFALFARVRTIYEARIDLNLTLEQKRLCEVWYDRLCSHGAMAAPATQSRLITISGRLAEINALFSRNLSKEGHSEAVVLLTEADLAGLNDAQKATVRQAAAEHGLIAEGAVYNDRASVLPFLTHSARREHREAVWRMWTTRGSHVGEYDNIPLLSEILRLRAERAALLGYESYAHLTLSDRMAQTPRTALTFLRRVWPLLAAAVNEQQDELQAHMDADVAAQAACIEPWDRLYYREQRKRSLLGLDASDARCEFSLERTCAVMFWAAKRLYGYDFSELDDAPRCDPGVRVYAVHRSDEPVGCLWLDLYARRGKRPGAGAWVHEYRSAEHFRGVVLPLVSLNGSFSDARPAPTLLSWEDATMMFHEFGHALHSLSCHSSYPSLSGIHNVALDFIEVPARLNERWIATPEVLALFTLRPDGDSPSADSIGRLATLPTSDVALTLEYVASAIVDLELHSSTEAPADPVLREDELLADLAMPRMCASRYRLAHFGHIFSDDMYAAGYYVYLWADAMASDAAEAFRAAPDGMYDRATATRWLENVLSVGNSVEPQLAFQNFQGRRVDPGALLRWLGFED